MAGKRFGWCDEHGCDATKCVKKHLNNPFPESKETAIYAGIIVGVKAVILLVLAVIIGYLLRFLFSG